MADTEHPPIDGPVEGDGVSYRGIVWFIVVLVITGLVCQVMVWGLFRFTETYRLNRPEIVRAPLAPPAAEPTLEGGQVRRRPEAPATEPALLVDEPLILQQFRADEQERLHSYGWVDQEAQTVRLPIDRAKDLLLERGLSTRQAGPAGSTGPSGPTGPAGPAGPGE
jgi:hypothetical protein